MENNIEEKSPTSIPEVAYIFMIKFMEENLEKIAEGVHNSWWEEKKKQGFHPPSECPQRIAPRIGEQGVFAGLFIKICDKCHPDMYPYRILPDNVKEYDRVTVRSVKNSIKELQKEGSDTHE